MRHTLLFAGLLLLHIAASAQYNSPRSKKWAFGVNKGLDFSNTPPSVLGTSIYQPNEGCASICDTSGQNLLFYSNGDNVWSGNGDLMPHGSYINQNIYSTQSTTQGTLIVPDPADPDRYYLFSLPYTNGGQSLFCNVVDMTLNNGNGDIDTTFYLRQVPIASDLTEKMTVARGCGNSAWVIVRSHNGNYLSYYVSPGGIDTQAVVSEAGTFPAGYYEQGVIKVSSKGDKLMACNFQSFSASLGLEVCDFDKSTGIISNALMLDDSNTFYGGTFSPDGTKVYAESTTSPAGSVYQFDLNSDNPASSKTYLGESGQYADMKIGYNGKIYFAAMAGSPGYNYFNYMACINDPDQLGAACNFQDSVTSLNFPGFDPSMGSLSQGLPNDIIDLHFNTSSDTQHFVALDTFICRWPESNITLQADDATGSNFVWGDNSTATTRMVVERGTYWVSYNTGCGIRIDTFKLGGNELPEWHIVVQNGNQLSTSATFDTYQWYQDGAEIAGADSSHINVNENGVYAVFVSLSSGCSDAASVTIINSTDVDDIKKLQEQITIYPNPAQKTFYIKSPVKVLATITSVDGSSLMQNIPSNSSINIDQLSTGFYLVQIHDAKGNWIKTEKLIKQ